MERLKQEGSEGARRPKDLRDRILERRPAVGELLEASQRKRELALALVRQRVRAGFTQSQLAERAGWQKSYLSRLESATDFYPDTDTIRRYVEACGGVVSLVFTDPTPNGVHVVDAVTLQSPGDVHPFESLRDQDLVAAADPVAAGHE